MAKKRTQTKKSQKTKKAPVRKAKPQINETAFIDTKTRVKVVGIGGGAGNLVAELSSAVSLSANSAVSRGKVAYIAANTDNQALKSLGTRIRTFQFGQQFTNGLGTGMNPKIGEDGAKEAIEEIKEIFNDSDLSILIACLGGGTGSGAAPVFAEISQKAGNVNLGIFTMPFEFEGKKRTAIANEALAKLKNYLNAIVIIPNQKIFEVIERDTPLGESFSLINRILAKGLEGLVETIARPSLVNIDFADLKTTLDYQSLSKEKTRTSKRFGKLAYLHCVEASGRERAKEAVKKILKHPLMEYDTLGAERILFNVSGNKDLKMAEVEEIAQGIFSGTLIAAPISRPVSPMGERVLASSPTNKARIIFGISQAPKLRSKIRISLLATKNEEKKPSLAKSKAKSVVKQAKKAKKIKKESPKPSVMPRLLPIRDVIRPAADISAVVVGASPKDIEVRQGQREAGTSNRKGNFGSGTVRRTGLEIKKETEQEERQIVREEEKWEMPAFLRRKEKGE